ncbi:retrotransposon protein, putative, ty1-copia subclass, partial [Tanacetum coccineum]
MFDLIQTFHACKQEEGKPVAAYILQMKGYVDQLERLGYMLPQDLIVGLILNGLTKDFVGFVTNYNMHNMGKMIGELHAMLIKYEKGLPKKVETPQGKDKQVYILKPKKPKPSAKEHPAKDDTCHHCKEVDHWKRNCLVYLAELLKKKKQVGSASSSVEAIGSYDLVLPNGLVICLDNCHYAPSITRGVVSVHRLVENGFVQCFTDFGISVSKNNVFYFNVIPSNDSTYLWHCRLAHISKKCIEKLQQEGLLKSIDDESLDGKMTRKSFLHRPERATDLLRIIYTDVCGPLRHVSRQ